jgi:hypothetical protein
MKCDDQQSAYTAARPDWTYSVPAPRTFSILWILDRLGGMSVPLALIALAALAVGFDLVSLP